MFGETNSNNEYSLVTVYLFCCISQDIEHFQNR